MTHKVQNIKIAKNISRIPLQWATTATHYFENEVGEYWIATIEDKKLLISGFNTGFEVITLTYCEALQEKDKLLFGLIRSISFHTLKNTIISKCEALWFLSIIEASLEKLKTNTLPSESLSVFEPPSESEVRKHQLH